MLEKNTPQLLSEPHLSQVKEFLETELGLHYTSLRDGELSRKLSDAAKGFGFRSAISFVSWLLIKKLDKKNLEKLASYLTIGETYFLRENEAFLFLKKDYLPSLLTKRQLEGKKINIWSAGCSSGEEVYSLAGMISELIPDIDSWQIKILGTDINPAALEKARKGLYSEWSFRKTPEWFMKKYVTKINAKEYQISEKLRSLVEFRSHNLALGYNVFGGQDIILCRNVLIYFSRELIKKVTTNFYDTLNDGGVLILSPVEVSLDICERFIKKFYMGRTFFVKDSISSELFEHKDIAYNLQTNEDLTEIEKTEPSEETIEDEDFERIEFLFEEGMYLRVENLIYKRSNDIMDLPANYKLLLAKTLANRGEYDRAEYLCLHLDEENGYSFEVLSLLVNIYLDTKEDKKALKVMQKIHHHEDDHLLCLYHLGVLELKLGYEFLGLSHLKRAQELAMIHENEELLEKETGLTIGNLKMILNSHLNRE